MQNKGKSAAGLIEKESKKVPLPEFGLAEDILGTALSDKGAMEKKSEKTPLPESGLADDILGTVLSRGGLLSTDTRSIDKNDKDAENLLMAKDRILKDVEAEKYVTFFLDEEEYALPIFQVQEIKRVGDITRVPNSPPHVRGVVNLRGKIIPVIELKNRLNLGKTSIGEESRIVVVENGSRIFGLMVDSVSQVLNITAEEIDNAPQEVIRIKENYISGIGKLEDRMVILIDLDKIIGKGSRD
ncbi:chemotaxis protein CheW [bacterium]|nr:chemotaxis protein CheW [bacterium]